MSVTTILSFVALAFAQDVGQPVAIVPEPWERVVERFGYSPAVRAGDFVYLSGVVAAPMPDEDLNEETRAAAYRRAFQSAQAILAAAGADWESVVEITSYHADIDADADIFMRIRNEFIAGPYPAWTAIDVDRLYLDRAIGEFKIVAYAPRQ